MPGKTHCPKCGAPVTDAAVDGFCTACLLEEGLGPATGAAAPVPFRAFGNYELLEEIARGGMGVVFKARQRDLNRLVAVKMILSGHLASEAEAQRFRAEARAAAALQHPGIVAIHEVGEHEGLLYFSMDYVEGQNLAQAVRDGPLSAQRAAECLCAIADAIHYAHEHGVLHRDLKPSNVLLDASGKPHVTDFGLAKRLVGADVRRLTSSQSADTDAQTADDQSLLTAAPAEELTLSGQVLGSPNFMPPEQAAGKHRELTPASDVYSLGALLYHLLTGRPPFLADSVPATLRLVSETEPVAPRLLAPTIPRDLETICLRCLEKDPQRRYAAAKELAEELQRFLNNEPIHARPISAAGKLWRWSRRNPGLARTATAALVLFLTVTIGGPIGVIQINHARKHAEARQKEATLEAARSQQFAQFMKAMLRSAGPSVARGRDATLLRELLEKTAARLETELRNQPEVQGDMYATLGSTYRDMGDYPHAIPMLEKAVAKYREAFRGDHQKLALALGYLGQYQSFNTDVAAGKRSAQAGLDMARRCGDAETLATCLLNVARSFEGWGLTSTQGLSYAREAADLLKKLTNNPTALADCYSFMAGATQDGDRAEAERLAREALELNSKSLEPDHPSVVGDIFMLGQIELDRGKFAEAEADLRETLRLHRKIYDRSHPHRFIVLRLLGDALAKQGKQAELEKLYREALEADGDYPGSMEAVDKLASIWRAQGKSAEADKLIEDHVLRWRTNGGTNNPAFADALNILAGRAMEEKRSDEGLAHAREASAIYLRFASNNLPRSITVLGGLASMLDNAGKYSDAKSLLQRRLELQKQLYGSDDVQIADALGWMAWVYTKDKRYPEEESALQERLAIQKKHFGSEHTNLLETLDRLASNLETQRKLKEAEALRQQSLAISEKNFGEIHQKTLTATAKLISLLLRQRQSGEAQALDQQLASRVEKVIAASATSTNLPVTIDALGKLCYAIEHAGRYRLAESLLEQRLALQRGLYGNEHKEVLDSLGWMAEIRSWGGNLARAAQVLQQKLDIQSKLFGRENTNVLTTIEWLAGIYEDHGQWKESEPLRAELLATRKKLWGDDDAQTVRAARKLGAVLLKLHKFAEAEVIGRDIVRRAPYQATNWFILTKSLDRQGKTNEVIDALHEQMMRFREVKTNELAVAEILYDLAERFATQKKWNDSETCAEQALEIQQRLNSTNLPAQVKTLLRLCETLDDAHKFAKAQPLLQEVLVMERQIHGTNELKLVKPLGWTGWAFQIDGKFAEAQPFFEERLGIQQRHFGPQSTNTVESLEWLVYNLEQQQKSSEADRLKKELATLGSTTLNSSFKSAKTIVEAAGK